MAATPDPPGDPAPGREPILARLVGAGARGGIRSAERMAEATGIDRALEEAAEAAVIRALESPAAERAIAQALESEAVERSLVRAVDSEMIDRVWERLLASDEAQKLVERIAQAPEIRQAIAYQGVGLIDDIGAQIGRIARHLDAAIEHVARIVARRPQRAGKARDAGLATRALAVVIDAAILNLAFFLTSTIFALGLNAVFGVSSDDPSGQAIAAGAALWLIAGSIYLVSFWSLSGETPGMRFLDLSLEGPNGRRLGLRRAMRRLAGTFLSAIPLGLGFLIAAFDDRRRTLADRIAQTEVLYLPPRREVPWAAQDMEAVGPPPTATDY